jgi:acetyltransferase-like isoleucine patch superfamily enzyme
MNKILKLLRLPFYERCNAIALIFASLKTQMFYRLFFRSIGSRSMVKNPLYLANVHRISVGSDVFIRDFARLEVVGEGEILIGEGVAIEQNCHITSAARVSIGKNTTVLFDVMITDIDHEYRVLDVPIAKQTLIVHSTCIGENCFIGSGARIQAGSILGKQCIVGANAVVRGEFPDYCVIAGVPAKIIKRYNSKSGQWEKTNGEGEFLDEK